MAEPTPPADMTAARPAGAGRGRLAGELRALLARPALRPGLLATALTARLASAGLLGWIGWVHWHLWQLGYRDIPNTGLR